MEGLDIINVSEDGRLLAGDLGWCIMAVCLLLVMHGKEIHLLDKL